MEHTAPAKLIVHSARKSGIHTLHPVGLAVCFLLVNIYQHAPVEGNLLLCGTTLLHVLPCSSGCSTALLRLSLAGLLLFAANRLAHMFKPCLRLRNCPQMIVSILDEPPHGPAFQVLRCHGVPRIDTKPWFHNRAVSCSCTFPEGSLASEDIQ